ncbi:uncharacterized protein LOC116247168 [Nymphaea colorata]|uniref:uncharacterized protein LOC116247168 n=1 Tax=Nymphaea colorata TaxID=210225 RepID=UPI00129E6818|nr:uncharacterized protein LOC116247168 [Nymphaea colorata]
MERQKTEPTGTATAGIRLSATLLLLLFLLSRAAAASDDASPPLLYPSLLGDACSGVQCGKGTCIPTSHQIIPYACECEEGWTKLFRSSAFDFLPCVIPNCTVDFSCTKPPIPALAPTDRLNFSIFDPCTYTYCGEGECVRTSNLFHRCDCREGYANLLNVTIFPCLSECFLTAECSSVGLFGNHSSSDSPSISPGSSNAELGLSGRTRSIITLGLLGAIIIGI